MACVVGGLMPVRAPRHRPYGREVRQHEPVVRDRQAARALPTNSKQWQAMRQETLLEDGYCCRKCGRIVTGKGQAHIDHIDGDDSNNAPSNRQTLCVSCHSAKTAARDGGFGNRRGAA